MPEKDTNKTFTTPMMKQYQEIKEQYEDCLLFFRLGDFYELFFDDAKTGSQVLNITLTRRPRGKDGDIPMAGVPFHAADAYIGKLVKAGHKVAICEQVSEPNKQGIVEREVVRIVTPGTILDEKNLEKKQHNYTMSLAINANTIGIALADLSTGDFQTTELYFEENPESVLGSELARFSPSECIVNQKIYQDPAWLKILNCQKGMNIYCFSEWDDFAQDGHDFLKDHFQVKTLQSFGIENNSESARCCASLLGYLKYTQKGRVDHIKTIRSYDPSEYVILDRSTISNLELFATIRDQSQKGSFINVIDETKSAVGARMLRNWISKPLTQKKAIKNRLDTVEQLSKNLILRDTLQDALKKIWDIPRIISRLSVGIGNAYDLVNLKQSLEISLAIKNSIPKNSSALLVEIQNKIPSDISKIADFIGKTIVEDPPIDPKNGGLIQKSVNKELDQLREQVAGGKNWIIKLEVQERKRTGISSLKVKFNKIFGYYIEISKPNLHLAPEDYLRKQTMVNAERFITPELKEYEEKILSGEETISQLEYAIFQKVVSKVLEKIPELQQLSEQIATLDCLCCFGQVAQENQYIKPQISANNELSITEGRHVVIEKIQANFVPNDTLLNQSDHQLLIITGPNMAGKSVFMRQTALIVLMAHIGCFVPANQAFIPLVDRIFVRSGASDFISSGLSTFMVEMVETAHILNHASEKSLIIMDEIGRGTSTYDGISIAWSVAQYIVEKIGAKTLFATHYHELQMLEDRYGKKIKNYNVAVEQKKDGDPIFLHKVIPGRSSHSYAIAVAKLAGVPEIITEKATTLLKQLESKGIENNLIQNSLKDSSVKNNFSKKKQSVDSIASNSSKSSKIKRKLAKLDLHNMTPIEALNFLAELQGEVEKN